MYLLIMLTNSALIQGVTSPDSSTLCAGAKCVKKTEEGYTSEFPGAGYIPSPSQATKTIPPIITKTAEDEKKKP